MTVTGGGKKDFRYILLDMIKGQIFYYYSLNIFICCLPLQTTEILEFKLFFLQYQTALSLMSLQSTDLWLSHA